MSTRLHAARRSHAAAGAPTGNARRTSDPCEALARVAGAGRERLLAVHRHRLCREDLEDCYSQATLEMLVGLRGGRRFSSEQHLANALAQRLFARVQDRRRALQGRSPAIAMLAHAVRLNGNRPLGVELADVRADVQQLVCLRQDLRRLARMATRLTGDQRLVIGSELSDDSCSRRFCARHGWSAAKYRQVAHRARARLRELMAEQGSGGMAEQGSGGQPVRPGRGRRDRRAAAPDAAIAFIAPDVTPGGARRNSRQGSTYDHSSPHT